MALKEAQRVGGGAYVNLHELGMSPTGGYASAPDHGTLAIFRIVDWEDDDCPPSKNEYGWDMPLIADVLVIEQDEDGNPVGHQVWMRQRIRFAPVYVLRGHPKPKAEVKLRDLPKPVDEIGDETITRIQTKKGGEKGWIALQAPSARDSKVARKVRDELGGDDWGTDGEDPF